MSDFIFFDTETTGLVQPEVKRLSEQPEIIEFCAIRTDQFLREIDRISFLCKPSKLPLPDVIKKITKIIDADLADKKPFLAHLSDLQTLFLGARFMVAHNVQFDTDLLKFELMRGGVVLNFPWPPVHICTVKQTMSIKGHRLKLGDLYEYLTGEKIEELHRAEADVESLIRVAKELNKKGMLI